MSLIKSEVIWLRKGLSVQGNCLSCDAVKILRWFLVSENILLEVTTFHIHFLRCIVPSLSTVPSLSIGKKKSHFIFNWRMLFSFLTLHRSKWQTNSDIFKGKGHKTIFLRTYRRKEAMWKLSLDTCSITVQ